MKSFETISNKLPSAVKLLWGYNVLDEDCGVWFSFTNRIEREFKGSGNGRNQ